MVHAASLKKLFYRSYVAVAVAAIVVKDEYEDILEVWKFYFKSSMVTVMMTIMIVGILGWCRE